MSRRQASIFRRVAIILAATAVLAQGPSPTLAASCNGPSHQLTLSDGRASPGSGSATTQFTFSVTYRDSADCEPVGVAVTVNGIGTFAMSGSGTRWGEGVRFTRTLTLPAGRYGYSFSASSGVRAGLKSATLTSVSPPTVTVTAPTATPRPATAAPTQAPKPVTPAPTLPPATPAPTPSPTPSPTSSPSPTISPRQTSAPTPTPSPPGWWGPRGTPPESPDLGPWGGVPLEGGGPSARLIASEPIARVLAWLVATSGGLALFMVLAPGRRRRAEEQPVGAAMIERGGANGGPDHRTRGIAEPPNRPVVAPDEEHIPRWLRPSVQAARQGRVGDE